LPTLGIVLSRKDRWSVDDPAQGYSINAGSRGTGSDRVLGSLIAAFGQYPFLGTKDCAARLAERAKQLSKLLDERGMKALGLQLTSPAFSRWPWNGIVSVPFDHFHSDPDDKEEIKYQLLRSEIFRSADFGSGSAGPRYIVEFDGDFRGGEAEAVDEPMTFEKKDSFCGVPVPCPPHGMGRFCVTSEHTPKDLEALVDAVARTRPP
jgi:hypothetical protein